MRTIVDMPSRGILTFPNPVNEKAARTVAAGVLLLAVLTLVTQWFWLLIPLAYGFVARVLTGPTLSPLGQLATRVVAPRLGEQKPVAGPPKRFAQAIGAVITVAATVAYYGFGLVTPTIVLVALVAVAAALEAVFAFCVGCQIFAGLMRLGMVPQATCEACDDVVLRQQAS